MTHYAVDAEWKPLRAVLLCPPHPWIEHAHDPRKVLYLKKIRYLVMRTEFESIVAMYKKLKIKVFVMDPAQAENSDNRHLFNLMFTRDAFFMTPRGAIMASMFSQVRRGEVRYVQQAIAAAGIRIRKTLRSPATFEGADALWVHPGLVLVGVGKRTNEEGFCQVAKELKRDHVECVPVPAPCRGLHLLGALQFVAKGRAFVKKGSLGSGTLKLLKDRGIKTTLIPADAGIRNKHAMNFVVLKPEVILMTAGCERTKKTYERLGIKVAAEVPTTQYVNAGGGLACMTGVLARG
ncbi:MAG: arginine deiminase family protein [Candidatus Omnitrophota bacterium]